MFNSLFIFIGNDLKCKDIEKKIDSKDMLTSPIPDSQFPLTN